VTARTTLVTVAILALAPAAAHAAPWSAPRSVTVSGQAREPVVALGGPDAAGVAYVRHIGGADRVELRQGTVDTLGTPVITARDSRGLDSTALTYSGHSALVLWRQFRTPDARVLQLSSVTRSGARTGPNAITGPPNSYDPAFVTPNLVRFNRRTSAYVRSIGAGRAGTAMRLPAGATFDAQVVRLSNGALVAVWPSGGAIYTASVAPGATAFGPATRVSAPGGFARTPKLAVTTDGHAVAVWTQADANGRALVAASAAPGAPFGAPIILAPSTARALTVQAIAMTNDEVLVTFVSARADSPAGPLQALQLAPDGHATTPIRTLTPAGERTRDAALAVDSGAGYAAWVVGGNGVRHRVRVVRIAAGGIVGTVRTVSGSDSAVSTPPAFAMAPRGRALIAYTTQSQRIRLVTRRAG
jgi:hypothetical protein